MASSGELIKKEEREPFDSLRSLRAIRLGREWKWLAMSEGRVSGRVELEAAGVEFDISVIGNL
jgi:hypothetical protein